MQNQNANVKHPFATDPKYAYLFGESEAQGLFSTPKNQSTPQKSVTFDIPDVNKNAWIEIENKARMDPSLACSPFPEADVELHKLFKVDDSEYVLKCKKLFLFLKTEKLLLVYNCTLETAKGVLYVTQFGIYFYSKKNQSSKSEEVSFSFKQFQNLKLFTFFFLKK